MGRKRRNRKMEQLHNHSLELVLVCSKALVLVLVHNMLELARNMLVQLRSMMKRGGFPTC
jgi:hypothetical protein